MTALLQRGLRDEARHRNEVTEKNGVVEIQLKGGLTAVVDAVDYPLVAGRYWMTQRASSRLIYARAADFDNGGNILMHRAIMGFEKGDGKQVDHQDGNGLNNRRSNLREATRNQNGMNRRKGRRPTSSRFKGVSLSKCPRENGYLSKPWRVMIHVEGRNLTVGHFETEEEAALAYNEAAREHYGEFAWLNQLG